MRNEVVIVHDLPTDNVDIYVYMGNHIGQYGEGKMEWLSYEEGSLPEYPTFRIDAGVWAAIMREAIGPEPSEAVLKDTRMIRDRLLTMIEQEWKSRQLEQK